MHGLAPDGPVAKAFLWEGDTLLEANGKKVRTPEDVLAEVQQNEITKVKFYRPDFDFVVDVKRADLLKGDDAMSQLGFSSWKKSHNWRSTGFYGHYTTYAEVLQLIASLVLGLFVAFFAAHDWLFSLHGRFGFRLSAEQFDFAHYLGMAIYKLGIILFNLVPYLALRVATRS